MEDRAANNYKYDANGNLTRDMVKDDTLKYNYRNLPFHLDFPGSGDYIKNSYDASGNRVIKRSKFYEAEEGQSGEYCYYLRDHLNSTRVVVKQDTSVVRGYDYYPFGMVMREVHPYNDRIRFQFTGKERDEGSNYDYFGARFYDAAVGRWMNVDPTEQYHSPFVYCGNDPINKIDKGGYFAISVPSAVAGGAAFVGGAIIWHNIKMATDPNYKRCSEAIGKTTETVAKETAEKVVEAVKRVIGPKRPDQAEVDKNKQKFATSRRYATNSPKNLVMIKIPILMIMMIPMILLKLNLLRV